MFTAICRHCERMLFTDAVRLLERHYDQMRFHLRNGCSMISLDLTKASIGELLKEYRLTRTADEGT
jgi:hypothetical protein